MATPQELIVVQESQQGSIVAFIHGEAPTMLAFHATGTPNLIMVTVAGLVVEVDAAKAAEFEWEREGRLFVCDLNIAAMLTVSDAGVANAVREAMRRTGRLALKRRQ